MLCRIVSDLNLSIFLYRSGANTAIEQADCENIVQETQEFGATRIYLAERGVGMSEINPNDLEPGRLGLIQVILPRKSGQILFMSEVAIKTDWIDSATGERCENRKLLSLFKRVKTELVKNMMEPVIGENTVTGGRSVYATIKYTRAAKEFFEAGGDLMQEGVNNVRFIPDA